MGGKRRKLQLKQQGKAKHARRQPDGRGGGGGGRQQSRKQRKQSRAQRLRSREGASIPFDPRDRILLVGEGDLSFAASLVRHHRCRHVTATVPERDRAELVGRHPSAEANIARFLGVAAEQAEETRGDGDENADSGGGGGGGGGDESDSDDDADYDSEGNHRPRPPRTNRLLYGVDVSRPSLAPPLLRVARAAEGGGPGCFDRIIFNFPHVGGRSTDVNRQVRHNQQLLVSLFRHAAASNTPSTATLLAPGGTVVVTLFEGEPYTLWNVRDLARHVGLCADRSFRFRFDVYPGYRHARTLGVVRSKKRGGGGGGGEGGEGVGGGWKGEDRLARSFVFARLGDSVRQPRGMDGGGGGGGAAAGTGAKRKRKGEEDEGESSEDEED